jgi:hypothetical protein
VVTALGELTDDHALPVIYILMLQVIRHYTC